MNMKTVMERTHRLLPLSTRRGRGDADGMRRRKGTGKHLLL